MSIGLMYHRVVPAKMKKVDDRIVIPTGPAESTEGVITAVDPEGIVIAKLVSGMMVVGYCAKLKPGVEIRRVTEIGINTDPNEELWIFNRIEFV